MSTCLLIDQCIYVILQERKLYSKSISTDHSYNFISKDVLSLLQTNKAINRNCVMPKSSDVRLCASTK